MTVTEQLGAFAVSATPPPGARARAVVAVLDTVGVMLAGSVEPVARIVQALASEEGGRPRCRVARLYRRNHPPH